MSVSGAQREGTVWLFHACVSSLIIMPAAVSPREKSRFWKKSFVGLKDAADGVGELLGEPLQA
jgi:hypothetical protein